MKKICLSIMALVAGFAAGAQTFSGGDGSEASPYVIKTVADMNELSTVVLGGNDLAGKYVRLESDIAYSSTDAAKVIGDNKKYFNGVFDGNNHTISGFKLNGTTSYQGVFGYIGETAVVKNLKVSGASVTTSGSYGGVLVGQNKGTIENCQVIDAVVSSTGGSFKGGVTGQSAGTVKNTTFTGTITTSASAVGTIVGQNTGKIISCYSSGTIVSNTLSSTSTHLGGIAAISLSLSTEPEITDCYFYGTITGGSQNNCGGIVGSSNKTPISDCFSAAYISGLGGSSYSGGIAGTIDSGSIKNCYSASTIYNEDSQNVGGIIGYLGNRETVTVENVLVYGAIFSNVLVRHEGCEFVGTTNGSVEIKNCYFDSQMCGNYSVGGAKTTKEMTSGSAFEGFDATVWTFEKNMYPRLSKFADLDIAKLNAVPVYLADGDVSNRVTKNFTLGAYADVEWQLSDTEAATLSGNSVSVTRGSKIEDVVITSYLGDCTKRSLVKVYPVIFSGSGTAEDPYQISSRADMDKLSDATNAQGMSFEREYFKLTGDIDMGATVFEPIAKASGLSAFAGIFDGAGYSLKNLALDNATAKTLNCALFGKVSKDGVVKNMTITATEGLNVYRNFAPFVCYLYGTVENCSNYASFTASDGFSGGIAYYVYDGGVVKNCLNAGNLTANLHGAIGGIVATNYGRVEGCANVGVIKLDGNGDNSIGGLVGANNGEIVDVLNAGVVSSNTGAKAVGGVVGTLNATGSISGALSVAPVLPNGNNDNIGAVYGTEVAGAKCNEAFYDTQMALYANNGATGFTTAQLTDAKTALFADASNWTRVAGSYPVLTAFAENAVVKFFTTPVVIADGNSREQIESGFDLPADIVWSVKTGEVFKVENGKLALNDAENYSSDELIGKKDAYTRNIPIATFGKFLTGKGTKENPYEIANAADLVKLSSVAKQSNNTFEGKTFKVTNDIDMTGVTFEPISPDGCARFFGEFDGNGKTISNLAVKSLVSSYTGLFGRLGSSAVVSDLTIGKGSGISGVGSVGAVAGLSAGKIVNCVNYASVSASNSNLGGIAGAMDGDATIENCSNYGVVNSTKDYVGGIVGKAGDGVTKVTVANCVNEGKVTGTTRVGGVIGHLEMSSVKSLTNKGEVKATTGANAGGIIGYTTGAVDAELLVNKGAVNGTSEVGGLVGYAYKKSAIALLSLKSSYNVGNVTGTKTSIGGLIGKCDANTIEGCFNMGDVTSTAATVSTTQAGAGGLVGYGVPSITKSYNVGNVTANSSVGGILAYPSSTYTAFTFKEVYSAGKVTATKAGATNVGAIMSKASTKATMTDVYYDNCVNSAIKAIAGKDDKVNAVSTKTLTEVDFTTADAWQKAAYHYPRIASLSEVPASYLSTAAVVLADGDNYSNVTKSFNVGSEQVTWTGDAGFTINGDVVNFEVPSAGEYKLTASADGMTKVVTLNIAATSGVNTVVADADGVVSVNADGLTFGTDADYVVYSTSGAVVSTGKAVAGENVSLEKGIYFVKVANNVTKVLVK